MGADRSEPGIGAFGLALVVAMLSVLAPFSIDTYLPSFPAIGTEFGAQAVELQQTLSLYMLAFAATTLVYGPLSDRFGRRTVVLWGLALYAASSAGCALAGDIHSLILLRVGQGLSASAGVIVGRAMIRDVFAGAMAQRVMSQVMMLFAVAPAIAPIIGGFLEQWMGWRSVFWFLAILGALVFAVVWLRIGETLAEEDRHPASPFLVARRYWGALRYPRFMVLVSVLSLNFGGFFLYIAGAPDVLYRHLGFGPTEFGWFFVPLVSGVMLGSFLSGRLSHRLAPRRTVGWGFAIMGVAAAVNLGRALWLPATPVLVIAPLLPYALGMAMSMPALTVMGLDCFPHHRGMASAVQGFAQTGFSALMAGVAVPLLADALWKMAAWTAVLLVLSLLLWIGCGCFRGGEAAQ